MTLSGVVVRLKATDKVGGSLLFFQFTISNKWRYSMFSPFWNWLWKKIEAEKSLNQVADRIIKKFRNNFKTFDSNDLNLLKLRINSFQPDEFTIYTFNTMLPNIKIIGEINLTEKLRKDADNERLKLLNQNHPNDPHAILSTEPSWNREPITFDVKLSDYASVLALRNSGGKPAVISSCAVILCAESQQLILHERSEVVDTCKGLLHTIGGAYLPSTGGIDPDRGGLHQTIIRESHEELQASLPELANLPPMMISKELETGFIQLCFLGVAISPDAVPKLFPNWEGRQIIVPFDKLTDILAEPKWCASGKLQVLTWLGLGAPNTKHRQKFGKLSPIELFEKIVVRA